MSDQQKKPYGAWPSPVTAALILESGVGLAEITVFDDAVYWLETRPREQGRAVIVRREPGGPALDLVPPAYNVRTRVHEYGGGAYLVTRRGVFFSNFRDQDIYWLGQDGSITRLTNNAHCRYADLVHDPARDRLICVREDHNPAGREAVNTMVAIALTGQGRETILVEGADFYSSPRLSPGGDQLCWISWSHPNMPWDNTTLHLAGLDAEGKPGKTIRVAGGEESVCQPLWSADGALYFVSDRSNWWNLYRYKNEKVEPVYPIEAEFAEPQWSFGMAHYDFIDARTLLAIYRQNGSAKVCRIDTETKTAETLPLPFTDYESLSCNNERACFLAASPTEFPAIIEYDLARDNYQRLRSANRARIDPACISVPESLTVALDGKNRAQAFFYPPRNRDYTGPADEKPPLIVMSHGGPTAESHNSLKAVVQFFTSRGLAVMDVNYGGSSGYGRAWRQRLNGQWGVVDVRDCRDAARYAAGQGRVDPARLAIRGGSAGGFTTLACLAFTDVFKAGASHYGVSDLEALARATHKFESRYLDALIGPYPAEKEKYRARSPLHAADRLTCPVIFFQGKEDRIVPREQARLMADALKKKHIPVACLIYEGEQHGFRQAKNIKRTLEAEYSFYAQIFGFETADEIAPVCFE